MSRHNEGADAEGAALAAQLLEIVNSSWMSQAVCVAAQLGIADKLADGPKKTAELAEATGCHTPALHRLLRALVTLQLCSAQDDGTFALTALGALLRTDSPNSVRSWAIWWGRYLWPIWANLFYSIKSGQGARRLVTGTEGFGHLAENAEMAEVFNSAMVELTRLEASEVRRAYDFTGIGLLVDVGGGYGELLTVHLAAYPGMRGILFDLPHAVEGGRPHLAELAAAGRCELVAGSFFESVPAGADAYLLKNVLHDWDDAPAAIILRNCRRAMSQGARLLLIEQLMPEQLEANPRHRAMARADLNMLVAHGARERSEAEFRELLRAEGFRVTNIVAAGPQLSILEAIPC